MAQFYARWSRCRSVAVRGEMVGTTQTEVEWSEWFFIFDGTDPDWMIRLARWGWSASSPSSSWLWCNHRTIIAIIKTPPWHAWHRVSLPSTREAENQFHYFANVVTSQHRTPFLIIFILTLVRSRESVVGQGRKSFPGAFPDQHQASPISGGHQGRLPLVVLMMMLFMEHYIKSDSFHSNTCLLGQ